MLPLDLRQVILEASGRPSCSLYDLHCHITSYDVIQKHAPEKMPIRAAERGLQTIVQTEHDAMPALATTEGIAPGMEVSTTDGHVVVVGPSGANLQALVQYCHGPNDRFRLPSLQDLVTALRDAYGVSDGSPFLMMPHPLSDKGVLHNGSIAKTPTLLYSTDTPYFLEWANAERIVTGKHVRKTVEALSHLPPCLGLAAGSDAHGSHHVGLAGVAVFHDNLPWNDAMSALRAGEHICYQFKWTNRVDEGSGILYLADHRGKESKEYEVSLRGRRISLTNKGEYKGRFKPFYS